MGLLLDSQNRPMFLVPPKKKQMVTTEINRLLAQSHLTGPTRLLLRNLFRDLKKKSHWNSFITLSKEAIQDLQQWSFLMVNWDGKIMLPMKSDLTVPAQHYSGL